MSLLELLKDKKNKNAELHRKKNGRAGEDRKYKKCKIAKDLVTGKSTRSCPKWTAMKIRDSLVEARIDLGVEFI